ncbi:hypothetical protein [Rhodospirillaceae bacterium SYSU D60014]|uniref:hypothetical protein n=1 Tax=Virgifigura deserti TaxID=2268457 RepID=UPI000E66A01D
MAIGGLLFLGRVPTLSIINAQVEKIEFRVSNAEQAVISVDNMRLSTEAAGPIACGRKEIEPALGSLVTYTSRRDEPLVIEVENYRRIGSQARRDAADEEKAIALVAEGCGSAQGMRLPVFGPGRLGDRLSQRFEGWSYLLLSGSLNVYGRTLSIPLPSFSAGGALYPAFSEPILLPAGSELDTMLGAASDPRTALVGFATVTSGEPLDVAVSTAAEQINVHPPGSGTDPIRIEIGTFTQILNDPNVLRLSAYILILVLLLPIMIGLVSLAADEREREKPDPVSTALQGAGAKSGEPDKERTADARQRAEA